MWGALISGALALCRELHVTKPRPEHRGPTVSGETVYLNPDEQYAGKCLTISYLGWGAEGKEADEIPGSVAFADFRGLHTPTTTSLSTKSGRFFKRWPG